MGVVIGSMCLYVEMAGIEPASELMGEADLQRIDHLLV